MLGRNDRVETHNLGYNDTEIISELELTNLITIATNKDLGVELSEEYLEKLKFILKKVAEEKIDRTMRQFKVEDAYKRR